MDITQIENTIAALAKAQGYTPLIVSEERLEREITGYPIAWIQLPKILYVEGRGEGLICHQIVVALLDDYSSHSTEDKRIRLNEMQEDILEILTKVSTQEGIVEIDKVTVTPRLTHTTRHGDIAQICQGNIISYF